MKKPNSQAETHSNQAGPPRDFHRYTQKHTAELLDHHVAFTEASELLQFCNIYFFYLYLDYKHKHAQDPAACHVAHAKIYFFLFIYRLQAQARATQEARTRCVFYLTSYKMWDIETNQRKE